MILLVLFSCKKEIQLKIERFPNGNVMTEIFYRNDSVKHGPAKSYFVNGSLKEEVEYINGNREGKYISYYENGNIEGKVEYRNDKPEGSSYYYNEQGALMTRSFWYNGKGVGATYFYRENGQIRKFTCRDLDGVVQYITEWDEDGKKVKEDGLVFVPTIYKTSTANGDSICLMMVVSEPPDYKTSIRVREVLGGKVVKEVEVKPVNSLVEYCLPRYEDNGHSITILGEIKDVKTGNLMLTDSLTKEIDQVKSIM